MLLHRKVGVGRRTQQGRRTHVHRIPALCPACTNRELCHRPSDFATQGRTTGVVDIPRICTAGDKVTYFICSACHIGCPVCRQTSPGDSHNRLIRYCHSNPLLSQQPAIVTATLYCHSNPLLSQQLAIVATSQNYFAFLI